MQRKTVLRMAAVVIALMLLFNGALTALAQSDPPSDPVDTVLPADLNAQSDVVPTADPTPLVPDPNE